MSDEDELRKAIRLALAQWAVVPLSHLGYIADAVLALPEVAALIADAERVRRVRQLAEELGLLADTTEATVRERESDQYKADQLGLAIGYRRAAIRIRRALDGDR